MIRGFASRQGNAGYNTRLAERRGNATIEEIRRSIGRSVPFTVMPLGARLRTHPFAARGGNDEDIHRSVEVSIHLGFGRPVIPGPDLEFEGEVVPGSVRPNQSFDAFKRTARRFAPTIPPMPERTTTDHATFAGRLMYALWNVLWRGGNPATSGISVLFDGLRALIHGDERIIQMGAVLGYADTMGRMVAALPATPEGRQPQLPFPAITDQIRSMVTGNELWLRGYRDGYNRVGRLVTELNNVRRPGEWPAERMLIHLRYRYADGRPPTEIRKRVAEGVMSEVLGIDLNREIGESVSPRQTP